MGYTHYWRRSDAAGDEERYTAFAQVVKQLIVAAESQGIIVGDAMGEIEGGWIVDNEKIAFNGFDKQSYETFEFSCACPPARTPQGFDNTAYLSPALRSRFDFTKTAKKPYDALVTAVLISMKEIYGQHIDVSSDGDWSEWTPGRALYELVTGKAAHCPWKNTEEHLHSVS